MTEITADVRVSPARNTPRHRAATEARAPMAPQMAVARLLVAR